MATAFSFIPCVSGLCQLECRTKEYLPHRCQEAWWLTTQGFGNCTDLTQIFASEFPSFVLLGKVHNYSLRLSFLLPNGVDRVVKITTAGEYNTSAQFLADRDH